MKVNIKYLVSVIAVFLSIFHLYTGTFGLLIALRQRSLHLLLGLVLIYFLYPTFKIGINKKVTSIHKLDILLRENNIQVYIIINWMSLYNYYKNRYYQLKYGYNVNLRKLLGGAWKKRGFESDEDEDEDEDEVDEIRKTKKTIRFW